MDRRNFIRQSCIACIGISAGMTILDSCRSVHYANGTLAGDRLTVPLQEMMETDQQGTQTMRSYIIVRHSSLQYPICVYYFNNKYKALWMRCTHQGAELQVAGDTLHCPAHGSEFSRSGKVTSGPAEQDLRSFNTFVQDQLLTIELK